MPDELNAFMATMLMPSQPLSVSRAVRLVRDSYGVEGSATRLTGERDENFRIRADDGSDYVLKVAHPAEDPAISDLTTAALLHLETHDPALPCPRVVRERSGSTHVSFIDAAGVTRRARLLSYLPGSPLLGAVASQRLRAACGRLGGRLTRALGGFNHPAARRAIVWDVRHAAYLTTLLGQLPGFPYRREAIAVLERIVPRIESRLAGVRHQIVHNDLNPRNILLTSSGEVSGIIDFGDMTYTAVVADVAVTAAEHLPEDCNAGSGAAASSVLDVANAYHEELPLLPPELAMLGTLVAARLLANLVVHAWHVHRNPGGEHYQPLTEAFIGRRLAIASELSSEAGSP